jgi:hypothetical protein
MTATQLLEGIRIDYVKFNLRLEWDRAEQMIGTLLAAIRGEDCNLTEGKDFDFTCLGADLTGDGKRRYVIEAWGEYAIELAALVPLEWFEDLSRVDVQAKIPGVDAKDVKAYATRRYMADKGKRNVTPYDSKPRKKTNKRDVGGVGLTIGSRKSKRYTIFCARGQEDPYVETRAGNQTAKDLGAQVLQAVDERGPNHWYDAFIGAALQFHHGELYQATGAATAESLALHLKDARRLELDMVDAMVWAENREEREAWEQMTLEQQEAMLLDGYLPEDLYHPKHRA